MVVCNECCVDSDNIVTTRLNLNRLTLETMNLMLVIYWVYLLLSGSACKVPEKMNEKIMLVMNGVHLSCLLPSVTVRMGHHL